MNSAQAAAATDIPAERSIKSEGAVSASINVALAVAVRDSSNTAAAAKGKADDSDSVVITAPAFATINSVVGGSHENPAEIPPEPSMNNKGRVASGTIAEDANGRKMGEKGSIRGASDERIDSNGVEEEDESEYEYEDEDDAAFSGFLVDHPSLALSSSVTASGSSGSPARIRDEDVSANIGGDSAHSSITDSLTASLKAPVAVSSKPRWREPSRQAVSMSLRAEKEKTGSKRRLAQDLYRIMNQDTEEAGFSIGPKSEDSMDHWIIKLFKFDPDSNLAKDMAVLGFEHIELEMAFPDQYPFEPPFVRVVRPRFRRQTGFVMNGALCMELLTNDGWNPVNDIESVIVSIRSLLVVGDGRLQTAYEMNESKYQARLKANKKMVEDRTRKRQKTDDSSVASPPTANKEDGGSYSVSEAQAAYSHLSDYHKKKGWDSSGWWARKG